MVSRSPPGADKDGRRAPAGRPARAPPGRRDPAASAWPDRRRRPEQSRPAARPSSHGRAAAPRPPRAGRRRPAAPRSAAPAAAQGPHQRQVVGRLRQWPARPGHAACEQQPAKVGAIPPALGHAGLPHQPRGVETSWAAARAASKRPPARSRASSRPRRPVTRRERIPRRCRRPSTAPAPPTCAPRRPGARRRTTGASPRSPAAPSRRRPASWAPAPRHAARRFSHRVVVLVVSPWSCHSPSSAVAGGNIPGVPAGSGASRQRRCIQSHCDGWRRTYISSTSVHRCVNSRTASGES